MKLVTKCVTVFSLCFFIAILPIELAHAAESEPSINTTITSEDGTSATILVDNKKEKKVETRDSNNIYIATNDKKTNVITIETYDLNRNLLSTDIVDSNKSASEVNLFTSDSLLSPNLENYSNKIMPMASSYTLLQSATLEDLYGYWIYKTTSKEIWVIKLRTGVTKSTFYSGSNVTHFKDFKNSVDAFMTNKNQIVSKVGSGILATLGTLYLIPEPTWTKVLAGLLTVISSAIAYAEGKACFDAYSDSILYYSRVKE